MSDHCERWKWRSPGEIIERLLAESGAAERRAQALIAKAATPQGMVSRETRSLGVHAPARPPRDRYYTQACRLRIQSLMKGRA